MRNLLKVEEPDVLKQNNATWLTDYLADKRNSTKKYRYRHPEIKEALKQETGFKCVYCESKIGHNTPGDIEHKIPSSKDESFHFVWENLTIACTECNRRKNDYYETDNQFLDPYLDDVESCLEHHGPLVMWQSSNGSAEVSVRILELNSVKRQQLIEHKIAKIEEFSNLIERFLEQSNSTLKQLLWKQIEDTTNSKSEYSAMLQSVIQKKGINSTTGCL